MRIEAISFDLDDTLFLQAQWLRGAWSTVANAAAEQGVDPIGFDKALRRIAAQGSAAGGIIDRALDAAGESEIDITPLVDAFRGHRAGHLEPLPGVLRGLSALRALVPVALITDGDVAIQEGKITDLGMDDAFDVVILSDRLGRQHRKPDPAPFRAALDGLGVEPARVVHVGDNPRKDVAGALAVGMTAVRVRTGEYSHVEGPAPWLDAPEAPRAMTALGDAIHHQRATLGQG